MKTWQQKFYNGKDSQVKVLDKKFGGFPAGTPMYISTPSEIDSFIRELASGESMSVSEMRDILAIRNKATFTCALTTGIFLRIVSELAFENHTENEQSSVTPFWRIVDPSSKLANKLSFDKKFIIEMRELENIT